MATHSSILAWEIPRTEKPGGKSSESVSHSLLSDSCDLMDYSPPGSTMGFSRQEYRGELPFSSLGDLPDPGIEPGSPTLQADSVPAELPGKPTNP